MSVGEVRPWRASRADSCSCPQRCFVASDRSTSALAAPAVRVAGTREATRTLAPALESVAQLQAGRPQPTPPAMATRERISGRRGRSQRMQKRALAAARWFQLGGGGEGLTRFRTLTEVHVARRKFLDAGVARLACVWAGSGPLHRRQASAAFKKRCSRALPTDEPRTGQVPAGARPDPSRGSPVRRSRGCGRRTRGWLRRAVRRRPG